MVNVCDVLQWESAEQCRDMKCHYALRAEMRLQSSNVCCMNFERNA